MTNIEKVIADGKFELFKEMQKGDNVTFCNHFGIPMRADTSYNLEEWMLAESEDELVTRVKKFIECFSNHGQSVINCFTQGCDYWFAQILATRFSDMKEKSVIMYSPIENHFVTKIGERYFDITGDVTEDYSCPSRQTVSWSYYKMSDNTEAARIIRECINKTSAN